MPTAPDPNSPYLASRLQAEMGMRVPGTPSTAGKPGVQAADMSFPAPPALATGPSGRPPEARTPAPTGAAPTGGTAPQAPSLTISPTPPVGAAAAPSAPTVPPFGTPSGTDAQGAQQFALSPDGDMRYRQAVVQKRTELGPMPRIFRHPSLPEMPVELGKPNYNAFTGIWG